MSPEIKNIIDKSVSVVGIKRVKESILKGSNYNLDTETQKDVIDYLDYLLSVERENKLKKILSEKVLNFSDFILYYN
jgi:hypothetical protein